MTQPRDSQCCTRQLASKILNAPIFAAVTLLVFYVLTEVLPSHKRLPVKVHSLLYLNLAHIEQRSYVQQGFDAVKIRTPLILGNGFSFANIPCTDVAFGKAINKSTEKPFATELTPIGFSLFG